MKFRRGDQGQSSGESPSTRRVWIEISSWPMGSPSLRSPSTRRVWIEIAWLKWLLLCLESPSTRRVWIEILMALLHKVAWLGHPPRGGCGLKYIPPAQPLARCWVTLHAEGVDLNDGETASLVDVSGHPPRGGCGLKLRGVHQGEKTESHPPRGGCGLK